jgi:ribosomal protein S18 acetylase RimI-like enzyme
MQGVPVGYLTLDLTNNNLSARVADLVVDEKVRRQGIASALLVSAQDWLKGKNIRLITIEMQAKNHSAISLCKKLRYEFSGYADNYYANRDIAVFFTLALK